MNSDVRSVPDVKIVKTVRLRSSL